VAEIETNPQLTAQSMSNWLQAVRAYLAAVTIGNLAWESLHVPLYTIWDAGTWRKVAFAVLHCTRGDNRDRADLSMSCTRGAWLKRVASCAIHTRRRVGDGLELLGLGRAAADRIAQAATGKGQGAGPPHGRHTLGPKRRWCSATRAPDVIEEESNSGLAVESRLMFTGLNAAFVRMARGKTGCRRGAKNLAFVPDATTPNRAQICCAA
jgi:hypothetical protein